jgi:glycosyltransferase involved in cell wall biosynthesis
MSKRCLRIAHIVANLNEGGAETLVRELSARIASDDMRVSILAVYPSRLGTEEKRQLGVPVIEIGRRGRADIGALWRTARALRRLKPDVVHAHVHTGKYLGRLAAILAGVPVVVFTEHDSAPHGGIVRRICDRFLNSRTASIVTFNEAQRRSVARSGGIEPGDIVVIPNGTSPPAPVQTPRDELRASLGITRGEVALLYPGRFSPEKNQSLAIGAMAELRTLLPTAKLLLAGDGPTNRELHALVESLGLESCVRFLGFRSDVPALLRAADLMVLSSARENMPLAAIEAMHAGLPIVSTPWDGAQEFFAGTAWIAAGWTPRDFALALEAAVNHPEAARERADEGSRLAGQRYDIAVTARAHRELYAKLAGVSA